MKCLTDSFTKPKNSWGTSSSKNTLIEAEMKDWLVFGTGIYPAVVINNQVYRGQIDPVSVFNDICAAFEDPPFACYQTLKIQLPGLPSAMKEMGEDFVTALEIVTMLIGIMLLNVLVLYCCRRRWRREMRTDMQS